MAGHGHLLNAAQMMRQEELFGVSGEPVRPGATSAWRKLAEPTRSTARPWRQRSAATATLVSVFHAKISLTIRGVCPSINEPTPLARWNTTRL